MSRTSGRREDEPFNQLQESLAKIYQDMTTPQQVADLAEIVAALAIKLERLEKRVGPGGVIR